MKKQNGLLLIWLFVFVMGLYSTVIAAETIRIGALFPFTGPMALLGQESFNGAIIAQEMVNDKGGIKGKKIEWVKADGVDPKKAMTECERLVSVEKVKVIFGTYSSSLSYAASEVAERNKVIYWEAGAIADPITERGFKYLFRTVTRASDFGILAVNFASEVVAKKLGMDPKKMKIGIMFEDSLYGTTVGSNAAKQALKLGMNVVATESYSHRTVDLSPIVMIFKARNPDVIIATSYLEDGILFWKQAKDLNLNVKAFIGTGACHSMPEWAKTFGDDGNYIFSAATPKDIEPTLYNEKTRTLKKAFEERFNKKFGHYPDDHANLNFDSARILFEEVIPRAGSLDPEAIRKAALQLDIPQGGTIAGYGVKFAPPEHPSAGQNIRAQAAVKQWQEKNSWTVYPPNMSVRKILLPMPTWEERAKGITHFVD